MHILMHIITTSVLKPKKPPIKSKKKGKNKNKFAKMKFEYTINNILFIKNTMNYVVVMYLCVF